VDLVRSGAVAETRAGDGGARFRHAWEIVGLEPGEYVYVRVVQVDGGMAWCSPFFVR
jgi:hypothetical protein